MLLQANPEVRAHALQWAAAGGVATTADPLLLRAAVRVMPARRTPAAHELTAALMAVPLAADAGTEGDHLRAAGMGLPAAWASPTDAIRR